jgi:hypothetical protein
VQRFWILRPKQCLLRPLLLLLRAQTLHLSILLLLWLLLSSLARPRLRWRRSGPWMCDGRVMCTRPEHWLRSNKRTCGNWACALSHVMVSTRLCFVDLLCVMCDFFEPSLSVCLR